MSSPESDFIYSSGRGSYRPGDNGVRTKKRRFEKDMTYGVDAYPAHGGYNRSYRHQNESPKEQIIISNLPLHSGDSAVKDGLFHEFKRFGHVSIYLRGRGESRIAIITYRNPDDTIKVKHHFDRRGKLILFDRQVHIDFESKFVERERSFSPESYSSLSPRRSYNNKSAAAERNYNRMKEDFDRAEVRYEDATSYRGGAVRGEFSNRDRPPKRYSYENYRDSPGLQAEDDPKASRTLFVGNLEPSVSVHELRRIFEPYGHVEDIEVKRPTHPQGSTYAFVKFLDIDVSARAKICLDGQFIGRNPCKIGYGRSMVSTRLWVGGLGAWTSIEELTREFDRFGAIKFIDFIKGNNYAYVLYDSLDAACVAAREMHGYPLGGHDRRLKIDFASPEKTRTSNQYDQFNDFDRPDNNYNERNVPGRGRGKYQWEQSKGGRKFNDDKPFHQRGERKWFNSQSEPHVDRNVRPNHRYNNRRGREQSISEDERIGRKRTRSITPTIKEPAHAHSSKRHEGRRGNRRHTSESRREDGNAPTVGKEERYERLSASPSRSAKRNSSSSVDRECKTSQPEPLVYDISQNSPVDKPDSEKPEKITKQENGSEAVSKLESIVDVAKRFAVAWRGAFALKTSAFPLRLHLVGGNPELADALLRAVGQGKVLSISQRLRLDQPKLEEVSRRVITAGASGHCILLALPIVQTGWEDLDLDKNFQLRNLRSLVVYLKQKQAAGVIPLLNSDASTGGQKDEGGILHAFPPCDYSHQHLLKVAPNLGPEPSKEDHLVMILVRGAA
eukprot:gene7447-8269_t